MPVPEATSRTTLSFTNLLAKTYRASCSRNKGSETCPGTMRSPVKGRDVRALPRPACPPASVGAVEQGPIVTDSSVYPSRMVTWYRGFSLRPVEDRQGSESISDQSHQKRTSKWRPQTPPAKYRSGKSPSGENSATPSSCQATPVPEYSKR